MKCCNRSIVSLCLILSAASANAQYLEAGGDVAMEAENYHAIVGSETVPIANDWVPVCNNTFPAVANFVSGYSGDGTMFASPALPATAIDLPAALTDSPRLDFDVVFTTPGVYNVWILAHGPNTSTNSVHVTLDGADVGAGNISIPVTPGYAWSAGAETIDLSGITPGDVRTINLVMRESGVFVDRIYLTTNGTDPNVTSPANSATNGNSLPVAAAPSLNPDGGPVEPTGTVQLATCTTGADIFYTLDGSDPTPGGGNPSTVQYSAPFTIPADDTEVRTIASAAAHADSTINSRIFDVDQFPVFIGPAIDSISGLEGVAITPVDVFARFTDPDGDPLTFSMTNLPVGTGISIDPALGIISGTPTNADTLASPIRTRVVATDPEGLTATDPDQGADASNPFDIVVLLPGQPGFTSTPLTGATTGRTYTYNITSSDTDVGDTLVVTATPPLPAWLTLTDGGTGDGSATLSGTPGAGDVGDHAVELVVTDSGVPAQSSTQSFTITVADPTVASILPGSRSAVVNAPVTAFATMINAGGLPLTGCAFAPTTSVTADFLYQTTDPATNALIGTPDTPVDLAAGEAQSFVFAFTPTVAFGATDISFDFSCDGAGVATEIPGVNTFILSASATPVADIIALAASATPGQVVLSGGAGAFAVATANVGVAGTVQVSASTGGTVLPVTLSICQTDPVTSACVNPVAPTASPFDVTIGAGETPTFGVFVSSATPIAFDPAVNRVFFEVRNQGGEVVASTSVAVSNP
jgi:hypothetical protein